eukprot:TRINITY_DN78268_c0_g1_i1.p1 TRINITY_DN78268_c0_g1~~TRINITY_DN78268_c0_g1_i1.p1  ORF type:complete len:211 (-),score=83.75 TRINITY_DN78268_c0_g1_i1:293-925(-)
MVALMLRRSLLQLLLLLLVVRTEADSSLEIIGKLKSFRDGTQALFESASESLNKAGLNDDAMAVAKWNTEWLSLLGVSRGITGLAKDFVLNYLGRTAYHNQNGDLVSAIREAGAVLSALPSGKKFDKYDVKPIAEKIVDICKSGQQLFDKDGSLHLMLKELKAIMKKDTNHEHFAKGLSENLEVRKAFSYFVGPRPGEDLDDDLQDDEEL